MPYIIEKRNWAGLWLCHGFGPNFEYVDEAAAQVALDELRKVDPRWIGCETRVRPLTEAEARPW